MSLLFPDCLDVVVEPTSLVLNVGMRDWRGRVSSRTEVLPFAASQEESDWSAAAAALEPWLAEQKWRITNVHVSVTDQFSRYSVISWPDGVFKHSELQFIAESEIQERLGLDLSAYEVKVDASRYGMNMIVCAMPNDLLAVLRDCFKAHRLRLTMLRPRFIATFNRWKKEIRQDGVLVSVEKDRCVLGVMKCGQWHSVRTLRVAQMDSQALRAVIERELLLHGMENGIAYVDLQGKLSAEYFAENESIRLLGRGLHHCFASETSGRAA